MKAVYILQSLDKPDEWYVGKTDSLDDRVLAHNSGNSPHTSKFRPWRVVVSVNFSDSLKADEFEKYLKSGSGRAFALRQFR